MKMKLMLATVAAASLFVVAGCTVDKTKEGNLPEVEVKGETQLPEYDVKAADVDVGTTSKTISVPTVDVNMPPPSDATPAPANP